MFVLSACLLLLVSGGEAARILAIFPTPSVSHQLVFQPIWKELSARHEVTVITPNPLKNAALLNLTEVDVHDISYNAWEKYKIDSMGSSEETKSEGVALFIEMYSDLTDAQLSSPQLHEYIYDKNHKFDLIIVEHLWPTFLAFKEIYNCPMIGITSLPFNIFQHYGFGNPMNPATYPDPMLPLPMDLNFIDRTKSTVYYILNRIFSINLRKRINTQVQKYFPNNTKSIAEISSEMSLGIQTVNPVLSPRRPNVPAVIDVSGLHINPPKPLPQNIKNVLDQSKNGVVYFSLGSNVKSSKLPKEKIAMLLEAFTELPYDVLWKFESTTTIDLPKNVHIFNWLPQQDVLRHPNVKAFVTQAGLQSIEEAIYSKVPLVAIPFFADQPHNAHKIESVGIGKKLDFLTLTKHILRDAIIDVAGNKKYKDKLSRLSDIALDQPMKSLDKAIWWIEYVIRHGGAEHLRSPTADIPLYQYLLLDVGAFLLTIIVAALYIFTKFTQLLWRTKYIL